MQQEKSASCINFISLQYLEPSSGTRGMLSCVLYMEFLLTVVVHK